MRDDSWGNRIAAVSPTPSARIGPHAERRQAALPPPPAPQPHHFGSFLECGASAPLWIFFGVRWLPPLWIFGLLRLIQGGGNRRTPEGGPGNFAGHASLADCAGRPRRPGSAARPSRADRGEGGSDNGEPDWLLPRDRSG